MRIANTARGIMFSIAAALPPSDEDDPGVPSDVTSTAVGGGRPVPRTVPLPVITSCSHGTVARVLPYYITRTHGFIQVEVDPMNSAS